MVVTYDYGHVNGGAAKVAIDGAIGLCGRGARVVYFAPVGPMDPRLAAAGVRTATLDQPDLAGDPSRVRAAVRGLWNAAAARRLREVLAQVDPVRGVVLQHGWSKAMSPACLRAIAGSGLPTVYYMHEYFAVCPNGAFYDYRDRRNCPLRPMSAACILKNCDAENYGRKLYRAARQAVALGPGRLAGNLARPVHISATQARAVAPWLPPGAPLVYAPNPIDVADRGAAPIREDAPFLFVGRFSTEKGAVTAAEAAGLAGVPIEFVGAGPREADIRAANPSALIRGWLPPDAATAAMRRARALVFPSIWREGQPLVVLEALASGLPPIVSRDCAAAEFVVDGETGLHVGAGDARGLAAAMTRLADVVEARRLGGEAHRRYWAAPHSPARHLDALEAALRAAVVAGRTDCGAADGPC